MKSPLLISVLCLVLQGAPSLTASPLANWTFQTSRPLGSRLPGVWFTNVAAEVGAGTASAWHSVTAQYAPLPGNGSTFGFGVSNGWAVGDFFQFVTSTVGYQDVSISYDQSGTPGGPGTFFLEYSTDGNAFTKFGNDYSVTTGNWKSSTASTTNSYSFDLSSVSALDNQAAVFFRIVDDSTIAINGGTVSPTGFADDRLDNVIIAATAVPEPSLVALGVLGAFVGSARVRARR